MTIARAALVSAHSPAAQRLQAMLYARFGVDLNLVDALDMLHAVADEDLDGRMAAVFDQDGCSEHPQFRREVWRYVCATGDTTDAYWAWVVGCYAAHGMLLPWVKAEHPAVARTRAAGLTAMYDEPRGWFVTAVGLDQPVEGTPFFHDELAAWINADDHLTLSARQAHGLSPRAWRALALDDQIERIHQVFEG